MRIINVKCKNWDKISADDYSGSLCPVPFEFKHTIDNAHKNAMTLLPLSTSYCPARPAIAILGQLLTSLVSYCPSRPSILPFSSICTF